MRDEKDRELSKSKEYPPPGGRRATGYSGRLSNPSKRKVHPYELRRKVVQLYLV